MTPTLNRSVNAARFPHFKFRWNVPPEANRIGTGLSIRGYGMEPNGRHL